MAMCVGSLVLLTFGQLFFGCDAQTVTASCGGSGSYDECYTSKQNMAVGDSFSITSDGSCFAPYMNMSSNKIRLDTTISASNDLNYYLQYSADGGSTSTRYYALTLTTSDSNYDDCTGSSCQWAPVGLASTNLFNSPLSITSFTSLTVTLYSFSAPVDIVSLGQWDITIYCDNVYPGTSPTSSPTKLPTQSPSKNPSKSPSNEPSQSPSNMPSDSPTQRPTKNPIVPGTPTRSPSVAPTNLPSSEPSAQPSYAPSDPTLTPSNIPTSMPSNEPSNLPTVPPPSKAPTPKPSFEPTYRPTQFPTIGIESTEAQFAISVSSGSDSGIDSTILIVIVIVLVSLLLIIGGGLLFCVKYHKKKAILLQKLNDEHYKQRLLAKQAKFGRINSNDDVIAEADPNGKPVVDTTTVTLAAGPKQASKNFKKQQKFRGSVANYMARNNQLDKLGVPGKQGADGKNKYNSRLSVAQNEDGRMSIMNSNHGASKGVKKAPVAFSLNFGFNKEDGSFGMVSTKEKDKSLYEGFVAYTGDMALSTDTASIKAAVVVTGNNGENDPKMKEKKKKEIQQRLEEKNKVFASQLVDAGAQEAMVFDEMVNEIHSGGDDDDEDGNGGNGGNGAVAKNASMSMDGDKLDDETKPINAK